MDGESSGGGRVGPGSAVSVKVTGRGGVPSSGVGSVVLNVTATGASASSFVTVFASGVPRPTASNLNTSVGG